ncbi:MAG: 16S rRNA (adenine(1518)-N(6)/adenine(1519)-N(6))-dimethyltransferase RsmA [Firmicutes bacterium]|nr:16S rRNA (adenine(1518)-N(6)/adenine(1519)-N(6))-dimethyltransferase RsmA [Bacillota bacterium]
MSRDRSATPSSAGRERSLSARVRSLMRRHGIHPRKRFGQNFLVNQAVVESILESAELSSTDVVIEIGSGLGLLTSELASRSGLVLAVEIDRELYAILDAELSSAGNVLLLNTDILQVDIPKLLARPDVAATKAKVVANLPYNITTPVLTKLVENRNSLDRAVVMVQKEVAERVAASPGSKAYGSLSVFVQFYADVGLVMVVPPDCFIPEPSVHSAVLRIDFLQKPRFDVEASALSQVVGAAFGMRRKILKNALRSLPGIDDRSLDLLFARTAIDPGCRAETLALDDFATLSREYAQLSGHV